MFGLSYIDLQTFASLPVVRSCHCDNAWNVWNRSICTGLQIPIRCLIKQRDCILNRYPGFCCVTDRRWYTRRSAPQRIDHQTTATRCWNGMHRTMQDAMNDLHMPRLANSTKLYWYKLTLKFFLLSVKKTFHRNLEANRYAKSGQPMPMLSVCSTLDLVSSLDRARRLGFVRTPHRVCSRSDW